MQWVCEIALSYSQTAFKSLYLAYFQRLMRFTSLYVPSSVEAEEIVSDTFLSLWNNRKSLPEISNFDSYIYGIARHKAISLYRTQHMEKVQIDEMRKEFLSHVSHELKTPIALIQGYSEGLKDNILDDEESKEFYCDVIADEAKKMNRMVQKLLTLNQIEFGNNQVNMERFDITEMIRNMVESSKILVEKQGVTIIFDEPEMHVWADEFMIEEVVNNYLSNARNHVTDGGIIKVSYCQNGNNLRVKVFNTGNHIPQEDIDKLWVKFYKVDKARTREYGGSGIGLSIVEATMKAHGRDYGVDNVEGGVEFYFEVESADSQTV